MGQVLHGSATTTAAVRRAIQHSQESLRVLAKRYGINPKTVAKWKQRGSVTDRPTGPREPRSTVLSIEDEAVIVAFRQHTLLPLDDCLYALQATIPRLTRSSLHRCLQRHGIGRLPEVQGNKPIRKAFKAYPIGFFHIDIAEVQTAEGKLYLFVAIDRTSKFAFTALHVKATTRTAADFLRALVKAVPYKIHTVLTDNGIHFTDPKGETWTPAEIRQMIACKELFRAHAFEYACALADIDHRLTKPKHPWTNGQVERMNRTIKDATVRRFHYDAHDQFSNHLADFVQAYNFAKRLKTLKGLTPYEFICKAWTNQPERFTLNPLHQMPGLNN
jgi:transposase InsO family protein